MTSLETLKSQAPLAFNLLILTYEASIIAEVITEESFTNVVKDVASHYGIPYIALLDETIKYGMYNSK